jgi:NAD(P)-dependent dehydrogenase (short-subunit alcohol dehydrogenase family)
MTSLSAVLKRNAQSAQEIVALSTATNPTVAVFVGGTSGIGEHTAYAFAKYTPYPRIHIVGRNADAGNRIVTKLQTINPNTHATFHRHDMTLISEADAFSQKVLEQEKKVNLLFLSTGFLTLSGRTETVEGIDTKMAINYYGRWRVVEKLLPLIEKAAESEENARVVTVLAPGTEGPVNMNDLDLKHNYSLFNVNRHFTEFNSLAVVRFAQLYPKIGFLHAGPGFVNTGIGRELPWYVRLVVKPLAFFATRPEDSGERFFYISQGSPDYRTGSHIIDGSFKSLKEKFTERGYLTPQLQETVWNHTEDMFNSALAKSSK